MFSGLKVVKSLWLHQTWQCLGIYHHLIQHIPQVGDFSFTKEHFCDSRHKPAARSWTKTYWRFSRCCFYDQNVIYIDHAAIPCQVGQYRLHQPLESGRGTTQRPSPQIGRVQTVLQTLSFPSTWDASWPADTKSRVVKTLALDSRSRVSSICRSRNTCQYLSDAVETLIIHTELIMSIFLHQHHWAGP